MGKTIPLRRAPVTVAGEQETDFKVSKTPLPYGFRYARDGSIQRIVSAGEDGSPVWGFLCSPIEFLASTENADGKAPGVLVRILSETGRWHQLALARSSLVGGEDLMRALIDHGLRFVPVGKDVIELKRLIMCVTAERRAQCVPNVGWHENSFVLPDEIIGQPEDRDVVFQPPYAINHHYRVAGTFDGWKAEVAARALGNSRLVFAISAAFAGPLLKLARLDGGGFHFRGLSSTGKSTALHVAGSVWGGGGVNGFVRSWRTTDNALEGLALIHNDTLLPLDEIAEVEPRAAFRTAYMLSNGQGKARSNKAGELRQSHEWRASFLSTGEISLASKVAEDGRKATAGQEVRVIDIPAEAGHEMGLFEELHGFNRASDFADALRDGTQRHYGHAARAFLAELVKLVPDIAVEIRETIGNIVSKFCPEGADSQVRRVARRFALAACAGEMAISFRVVPWPELTAYNAALDCFEDWLRSRGGAWQKEENDAVEAVTGFVSRYGSRFRCWERPDDTIHDCAGFFRDTKEGTTTTRTFYVFRAAFQNDICGKSGIDHEYAADVLHGRGLLKRDSDGKRTRKERLPGIGNQRVYLITIAVGDGE